MAKIESKLLKLATTPYSSWVVFDLARSEQFRPRVLAALQGHAKELAADANNRASQFLATFVQKPSDASIFEKPSDDPKDSAPKPKAKKADTTTNKSPAKPEASEKKQPNSAKKK
jgi:hypothetical protein